MDFVRFSSRREWQDVQPVPQDEGPEPVVPINYGPEFRETMDYFRAIMQRNELSERALALTLEVIEQNPANYTAWHYRRKCLEALDSDMRAELEFVTQCMIDTPKNYQIWQHRRYVVGRLGDASDEMRATAAVLADDAKNYHAWAHRQWVLQTFGQWEGELEFVEGMLSDDVRNNSAWNQRFFVISRTTELSHDVCSREIEFALHRARLAPHNDSPYAFLRGLMKGKQFADFPQLKAALLELKETEAGSGCPPLLGMLVDVLEEEATPAALAAAIALCTQLAEELDIVRAKYWLFRREGLGRVQAAAE